MTQPPAKLRDRDSWRRLNTQLSPPAPTRPLPPAALPVAPPAGPARGLQLRRSAPAPASARVPAKARAQPSSLPPHPLQSSFTKLSDFLSPKGVSWGEEAKTSCFPHRPPGIEGLVPAQNLPQHQFLPAPGGCAERGGRRGMRLGRRGGIARGGVGWEP